MMQQILDSHGIQYRTKHNGSFFYVTCPFHSGSGSRQFWIHGGGRKAKCHKCGHVTDWEGYAKVVGLPKLQNDGPGIDGKSFLGNRLQRQNDQLQGESIRDVQLPPGCKEWDGPWRKLSAKFLSRAGAFRWWDRTSAHDRILLPITSDNKLVGYTAGRADYTLEYPKNDPKYPKYRTSRGLSTQKLLYFLDQTEPLPILVLVEGPYDCLRQVQAGIPCAAIMGADNWAPEKTDLLLMRPGLEQIFVAADSDEGGDKMWKRVRAELKDHFPVRRIRLPAGKDPGDMPLSWSRTLKAELMGSTRWDGNLTVNRFEKEEA